MGTRAAELPHQASPRGSEILPKRTPETPQTVFPYKIEGSAREVKESFWSFAKSRIVHIPPERLRMAEQQRRLTGRPPFPPAELYVRARSKRVPGGDVEIVVEDLRIAVNVGAFRIDEKDYSDLIPFVEEHEIYEVWLLAREGATSNLEEPERHKLALRREFGMAEKQGLGEKLLEWHAALKPSAVEDCRDALAKARKRQQNPQDTSPEHQR